MSTILIIDDDKALCRSLQIQLEAENHSVKTASSASEGISLANTFIPDTVFLDVKLPDMDGLEVLNILHEQQPGIPVVMITGQQDMKTVIEAMKRGAFDYLRKPFLLDDVLIIMERIKRFNLINKKPASSITLDTSARSSNEIVGTDKKIVEMVKQIGLLSRSRIHVLIEGESGTGKELVARALHEASSPGQPFIAVNCSAIVPTLFESELFGHEKGAFTGADRRIIGKLEHAGEGSVFLDEIGDMPFDLQAKLLRVLQEREFNRVGSLETIPYKARTITATNRDLEKMVKQGKFRQDLYFRLAVSRVVIPPLRERREDIPLLAHHLIGKIGKKLHRHVKAIEDDVIQRLKNYHWPGNVRELENVLTRAIALARSEALSSDDLEFSLNPLPSQGGSASEIPPLSTVIKEHVLNTLYATGWNITRTAKILQISPSTLRKKINDFNLHKD